MIGDEGVIIPYRIPYVSFSLIGYTVEIYKLACTGRLVLGENSGSCRGYHSAGQREGYVSMSANVSQYSGMGDQIECGGRQERLYHHKFIVPRVYSTFLGYSPIIFCG